MSTKHTSTVHDILTLNDTVRVFRSCIITEYDVDIHAFHIRTKVDSRVSGRSFWYPANASPFNIPKPLPMYYPPDDINNDRYVGNVVYKGILSSNFEHTGEINWVPIKHVDINKIESSPTSPFTTYVSPVYKESEEAQGIREVGTELSPNILEGVIDRLYSQTGENNKVSYIETVAITYVDNFSYAYSVSGAHYKAAIKLDNSLYFWCPVEILKRLT